MSETKYLFEEFSPISTQEWEDKIIKDLKGADYERKLIWRTNEGFNVRPYYRAEDLENLNYLNVNPTEFPFVRGNNVEENSWFIRQDIFVEDYAEANKKALDILNKGIDSLGFVIPGKKSCTKDDLATLLKDIHLPAVEINFIAGHGAMELAKVIAANVDKELVGSFAFDPLMCLAKTGNYKNDGFINDAIEVIKTLEGFKKFQPITIWGDMFGNAGSSIVQELGYSLAVANEYMAGLTEAGIKACDAAKAIKFQFSTGSNYFMEIAKVRAARILWAQIVKQYNPCNEDACIANIHAVTSDWNKSVYDPYVNMLRTQTEAMSSILGGVNSMTVKGFNSSYEQSTEFSERIARNQQILLKEESHFDKVVDPSAGSYYIENLTDSIAEEAWKLFLEVEDLGGFEAAFKAGKVQEAITAVANKRDMDVANRKENLLGINQFPNFTEAIEKDLDASLFKKNCACGCGDDCKCDCNSKCDCDCDCIATPLKTYRGAAAIEAMRYKTDIYAKANKRPLAFMLTIGNLTMRKARAQFACNFFAVAGFEVQDNNGFETVEEGIAAAKAAGASIIVVCSSDDEYTEIAPAVKAQAGDAVTVVAGFPKAIMDDLKAKGVEHFIHVKSNLLDTLTGFQKELGI